MSQFVVNLKDIMDLSARDYISTNVEKFKSTTPGPAGPDGPIGPEGVGVHHMKGTSTTDSEGDFNTVGELDTYTFYADANEEFPLAWFTVKNGEDPWKRAIDKGYRGTEEEFYIMLSSVEEYATIALESINITEENKQFVITQAQIVAADKLIVEQNMNTTISNREQAELLLKYTNSILLGNKASDPLVDNNGDVLTIGSMYYNTTENVLKVWSGTIWFATTLTFNGRAGEVVLLNSDVTSAVGRDVPDALNSIESSISNVDNTADIDKSVLSATKLTTTRTINGVSFDGTSDIIVSDDTKIPVTDKGVANGVASLNGVGQVPAEQLPSYVDDILEVETYADLPVEGETGKIYVVISDETSKGDASTYRWTGTIYVMVSNTLNASDVKALYESNLDTNAYTDAEKSSVDIAIALTTTAKTLPTAINELDSRLDDLNVSRADKVLASKDVAKLIYDNGNLVKIRYAIDDDIDYEVLTYVGEDLANIAHYIGGVLQGNTILTHSGGDLVSSIFIGV